MPLLMWPGLILDDLTGSSFPDECSDEPEKFSKSSESSVSLRRLVARAAMIELGVELQLW